MLAYILTNSIIDIEKFQWEFNILGEFQDSGMKHGIVVWISNIDQYQQQPIQATGAWLNLD